MRISSSVTYPSANGNILVTSQLSVKQCLIDINNIMLSSGLVRSVDTGQCDTTSTSTIADVALKKYTSSTDISSTTNYTAFPPLIYILTDSWQSTKPVYIRIELRIAQCNQYNNNISSPNQIGYICYANVKIGGSTDGAGTITSQYAEQNLYHTYAINATSNTVMYDYHNKSNSYVNWNSTKGIVNVNICPNMLYWITPAPTYVFTTAQVRFSLVRFVIKRLSDGTCIIIFPNCVYAAQSTNNVSYGISKIYYLNGTGIYADTTNDSLNTFKQQRQNYVNNKIVTTPITVLLSDGSIDYDPYILIGSTYILGYRSDTRYDVVINQSETYKYRLWSGFDGGTVFDSTSSLLETSLLIYDEDN